MRKFLPVLHAMANRWLREELKSRGLSFRGERLSRGSMPMEMVGGKAKAWF
jgi:hypothetical protein